MRHFNETARSYRCELEIFVNVVQKMIQKLISNRMECLEFHTYYINALQIFAELELIYFKHFNVFLVHFSTNLNATVFSIVLKKQKTWKLRNNLQALDIILHLRLKFKKKNTSKYELFDWWFATHRNIKSKRTNKYQSNN